MFLQDHEIAPRRYELSSALPFSIRDQMIRGMGLADRLVIEGVVPSKGGRLLVVGGGVAGVTTALRCVKQGIEATLVEQGNALFTRFAACSTRRIDPTLYDWPATHWRDNRWRVTTPLPFRAGSAAMLARQWNDRVVHYQTRYPTKLRILHNASISFPIRQNGDGRLRVRLNSPAFASTEIFDAIIYAAGMGDEKTYLGDSPPVAEQYRGPLFWENDALQQPNCGYATPPRILIAGAGDGALQDYIRVVTGRHPAQVMMAIDNALQGEIVWHTIQNRILSFQEGAARQYAFGLQRFRDEKMQRCYAEWDEAITRRLNDEIEACMRQLYAGTPGRKIDAVIQRMLRGRSLPAKLTLLVRGKAFTWCFALNRFLVLLLRQYLLANDYTGSARLGETIKFDSELTDVTSTKDAYLATFPNVGSLDDPEAPEAEEFDIVLIRIGVHPSAPLYEADRSPRARHMLPYHPIVK